MSVKRSVGKAMLAPLIAAGTSVAARYVARKGPEFVEATLLPKLRDAAQGGGDLSEQMTDRAREATGGGGGGLSQDERSRRSDERARRRAERRKTSKRK